MKKIVFFEKGKTAVKENDKSRVTIQLRSYDSSGEYSKESDIKNATIHIKNVNDVSKVFEVIKNALMNSKYLDDYFEVED